MMSIHVHVLSLALRRKTTRQPRALKRPEPRPLWYLFRTGVHNRLRVPSSRSNCAIALDIGESRRANGKSRKQSAQPKAKGAQKSLSNFNYTTGGRKIFHLVLCYVERRSANSPLKRCRNVTGRKPFFGLTKISFESVKDQMRHDKVYLLQSFVRDLEETYVGLSDPRIQRMAERICQERGITRSEVITQTTHDE